MLRLKISFNLLFGGNCLLINLKNTFPMFVFTFLENGRLNHMIFCFLFFLVSVSTFWSSVFKYFRLYLKPLSFKASLCNFAASLNKFSFDDVSTNVFQLILTVVLKCMGEGWNFYLYIKDYY